MNFNEENLSLEQLNITKHYKFHLFIVFYLSIKNNNHIHSLLEDLKLSDLLFEEDKIVLETIIELHKQNEDEISSVKIISYAKNKWSIDLSKYFKTMWNTIKNDISKAQFSSSLNIVKDNSKKIKFFDKIENLPSKLKKNNFEDIVKLIEEDVSEIRGSSKKSNKKEQFEYFRQRIENARKNHGNNEITGFKSFLTELDNLILGFEEESMNVIAARPGMGKTALILSIIANHIMNPKDTDEHILFFSLEMPSEQLIARLVSIMSNISLSKIRSGDLTEEEFLIVLKLTTIIENSNFHIEEDANVNIYNIEDISKEYNKKYKLSSIFIDYIQLVNAPPGQNDRRLVVDEISRKIKILAKTLKLPIIALAQLNRMLEQRADKRPMLSDLRESGAIEQDADRIIFLYRDSVYADAENKETNNFPEDIAELILAKHRNGSTGVVYTKFVKKNTFFIDADKEDVQKELVDNIKNELKTYAGITEQDLDLSDDLFDIEIKN